MRFSVLLLSLPIFGFSSEVIWNDSINGSSWNYANHWSPPGIPGPADTAIFNTIGNGLSTQFTVSVIAPVLVGSIEFNNGNSQTGYLISGATPLQLISQEANSLIQLTSKNKHETIFDIPIILGNDLLISNQSLDRIVFEKGISGAGSSVSVTGNGAVVFSGSMPNTFSGTTSVSHGKLILNKDAGAGAIAGNLHLDSSVVELLNDNQIHTSVSLNNGSLFNIGSSSQTLKELKVSSSSVLIGNKLAITETLSLSDNSIVAGDGTLFLAGENSGITFNGISQKGSVNSHLNLGNKNRTIAVNSSPRLSLNGQISNGGIVKTGTGILDITNVADLTGLSIEQGGLHLNGTLASASPVQISPGAFLFGKGSIQGNLNIEGTMSFGEIQRNTTPADVDKLTEYFSFDKLHVDGTPPSELLFLTGDQTFGAISDGIQVSGDITFSPESTLIVKFSPSILSTVDIDGKIILDSPNIQLVTTEGTYRLGANYGIIYAGAIQGQVGAVINRFVMLNPIISYITEDSYSAVTFSLSLNRFYDLYTTGNRNGRQVAEYLDRLVASPCGNSPIIIEALYNTPTQEEINAALVQMQPSAFTSLSVIQQNDLFYIRNAIYSRLNEGQKSCFTVLSDQWNEEEEYRPENSFQFWGGAIGGFSNQTNQSGEPGYLTRSPGLVLGLDATAGENAIFGGSVGYIYTFEEWNDSRGNADIQNIYGSLYSQYTANSAFIEGSLTGGYSFYDVQRKITFGPSNVIHTSANSNFGGVEGSIGLRTGAHFPIKRATMTPFAGIDYMLVHQNECKEEGARSLNLKIDSHLADLLTSEGGFEFSFCQRKDQTLMKALLRFSAIVESRFFGHYEKATFACGGNLNVRGLYPSRVLGSAGVGISIASGNSTFSGSYQAKTNWRFTDQFLSLEYLWRF